MRGFNEIHLLDLHGSSKKEERAPDGRQDENVFDIQQGVSINLFVERATNSSSTQVFHADLWGKREEVDNGGKYAWLEANDVRAATAESIVVFPKEPQHLFAPRDDSLSEEYEAAWSIPSIFSVNGDPAPGIITTHDQFAISWTHEEAVAKVERLLATRSEKEAREIWRLCSQNQWQYDRAKQNLANGLWRERVERVSYRPFDIRVTIFDRSIAVHRRERVMRHMLAGKNLALHVCRQTVSATWQHVLSTSTITDDCYVSNKTKERGYTCPLYVYQFNHIGDLDAERSPNLNHKYIQTLSAALAFDFVFDRGRGFRLHIRPRGCIPLHLRRTPQPGISPSLRRLPQVRVPTRPDAEKPRFICRSRPSWCTPRHSAPTRVDSQGRLSRLSLPTPVPGNNEVGRSALCVGPTRSGSMPASRSASEGQRASSTSVRTVSAAYRRMSGSFRSAAIARSARSGSRIGERAARFQTTTSSHYQSDRRRSE